MSKPADSQQDLEMVAAFHAVRRMFFPRWKSGERWSARFGTRSEETAEDGFCDIEARVVHFKSVFPDPDARDLVLIHEITHAVAGLGHGVRFRRRILVAANTATTVKRHELAQLLQEEAAVYAETPPTTAQDIYDRVHDIVLDTGLGFDVVMKGLAQEFGMTVSELKQRYRRLDAVWREATELRNKLRPSRAAHTQA